MKTLAIALLSLLPITVLAADSTPAAASLRHAPGPKLEFSVKPATSDTFQISAVISDGATGKVLATPSMTVKPGTWASLELAGDPAISTPAISLAVTVTPNGQGAAYFAEFRRDGGITDSQRGTLVISR